MINRKIYNFISEWNSTNNYYTRKFIINICRKFIPAIHYFSVENFLYEDWHFFSVTCMPYHYCSFKLRRNSLLQKIIRSFYPGNWASSMKSSVPMKPNKNSPYTLDLCKSPSTCYHQAFFKPPLESNKNLLVASIRTQVDAVIFSLIIKSSAELRTVFKIWACNPLKKPGTPSLFHIARIAPGTVLRDFFWAFSVSLSFESTAWIMTLHLYEVKIWNGYKHYALTCSSATEKTCILLISKRLRANYAPDCRICQNCGNSLWNCT